MPKSKVRERNSNRVSYTRLKFRLGGRNGNQSAARMTTPELEAMLAAPNTRGRDKSKIRKVLDMRYIAA